MRSLNRIVFQAIITFISFISLFIGTAAAQTSSDDVILYASEATVRSGGWAKGSDSTAAGGYCMRDADAGAAKLTSPLANPTNYFELTFNAEAGRGYRLWIRGKAQNDYWGNDSVFVQFSGSVTASGAA
ncbi:MAG TPA: hypothetical protein VNO70_12270, partial [Blastocatellia bacterium]|nr:hypothetical protein [Blastocatellia bacterium]